MTDHIDIVDAELLRALLRQLKDDPTRYDADAVVQTLTELEAVAGREFTDRLAGLLVITLRCRTRTTPSTPATSARTTNWRSSRFAS